MKHPTSFVEYERTIYQLKMRHLWLATHWIEPATGHLTVLEELLEDFEQVFDGNTLKRIPMLMIHADQGRLMVGYLLPKVSKSKVLRIQNAVEKAVDAAAMRCGVCGCLLADPETHPKRCPAHMRISEIVPLWEEPSLKEDASQRFSSHADTASMGISAAAQDHQIDPARYGDVALAPEKIAKACPEIQFLEGGAIERFLERHRPKKEEQFGRAKLIAEKLKQAGHDKRKIALLPDNWEALLDEFESVFPNFHRVCECLRDHFALSSLGDTRVSWPPILMVGPPGVGKTEAASWLANKLGLPFRLHDMANAQSSSILAGSESFWSNSEPGDIFELLGYQAFANPVLMLDEVDKVVPGKPYDPMAPLYGLLEPRSARQFRDLSIRDFTIDASHINWLATANTLDPIPTPILARFHVEEISPPNALQSRAIAQSIYGTLRAEARWGELFSAQLDSDVIDRLITMPPRMMKHVIRRACGMAARRHRTFLVAEDIANTQPSQKQGMGFMG